MNRTALKSWALDLACFLPLAAIALAFRWPSLKANGFHNEDAAGIVYNAELLLKGLLPYVDSLELKAPGSFFIVAGVFKLFGRSITAVSAAVLFWSILTSAGIFVGAKLISGRLGAFIATALYVFSSPISDSFDFNYNAWMMAPYVWSAAFALLGLQRGGAWWFGSGLCIAFAGLIRRQTAVICPLLLCAVLFGHLLLRPEHWRPIEGKRANRLYNFIWLASGVCVGFLPISLFYLAHGQFHAFVQNYAFSNIGWKYIGQSQLSADAKWARFGDGLLGFQAYLVLAFALAGLSTLLQLIRGPRNRITELFNWIFFLLSFVGAALGLRFFKSYYIQMLPAAIWLSISQDGALIPCFSRDFWRKSNKSFIAHIIAVCCTVGLVIPATYKDVKQLRKERRYAHLTYGDVTSAAKVIKQNTTSEDRIWVWGRWAWPFYYHTERMAASRQYKSLGILTNDLTNTWRRPTVQTRFLPNTPWPELMDDLKKNRPAYIILSKNELLQGFDAFLNLLAQDYRQVNQLSGKRFTIYRRNDHEGPQKRP